MNKFLFIASMVIAVVLLNSCKIPMGYPDLWNGADLHIIMDFEKDGNKHSIDYTDNVNEGIQEWTRINGYLRFGIEDHIYDILDYHSMENFHLMIPENYLLGKTYTRTDYNYSSGTHLGYGPAAIQFNDYDYNPVYWDVMPGQDDADGTSISISIDGQRREYVWGSFKAQLIGFNQTGIVTIEGDFSTYLAD